MDEKDNKGPIVGSIPERVPQSQLPCAPYHAWTCTVSCDLGPGRGASERFLNIPGAEVCAVSRCHCAVIPPADPELAAGAAQSVQDTALPLALVVFGIEAFLKR